MRKLDIAFVNEFILQNGLYHPILENVIKDSDLDFQIRDSYINIYYKGNSILKLCDNSSYEINKGFVDGSSIANKGVLSNNLEVSNYLKNISILKSNVLSVKSLRPGLEIEFEQLFVRVNNMIKSVNSEYYITDRQFADGKSKLRFDLSGICWPRQERRISGKASLAFFEIKYSNNPDIKNLDKQISNYFRYISLNINKLKDEAKSSLDAKISLGLIKQDKKRLDALKTVSVSNKIEDVKIIIVLIDYNPYSKLFNLPKLKALSFSSQIRIFKTGLGVWEKNLEKI